MAGSRYPAIYFMPYKDIEKRREVARKLYKERHREKHTQRVYQRVKSIKQGFAKYKADKHCAMCGENDPVCLEFHHIDPATKEGDPSELVKTKGWALEKIIDHVEKTCICVCANCHRKIHKKLTHLQVHLTERQTYLL